jgi:hypothetical protein
MTPPPPTPPPDERLPLAAWLMTSRRRAFGEVLALLCGLIAIYLLIVGRAAEIARPRVLEDQAQLRAMQPEPVPDAENAAVVYRQAFAASVMWKDRKTDPMYKKRTLSDEAFIDVARTLLANNARALALGDQAAEMPSCNWGLDYSKGFNCEQPHLGRVRRMGWLYSIRMELAAHDNDWRTLERSLRATFTLARRINADSMLINAIVAVAAKGTAFDGLERALADSHLKFDASAVARLRALIQAEAAPVRGFVQSVNTEEHMTFLVIDQLGAGQGDLSELMVEPPFGRRPIPLPLNIYAVIYQADREYLQRGYDLVRQWDAATIPERAAGKIKTFAQFRLEALRHFAVCASSILPMYDRASMSMTLGATRWKVASLALGALEWNASHHGAWPTNLEALGLTTGELIDPCDNSGAAFHFKAVPTTFTVWSAGQPGVDRSSTYDTPTTQAQWRVENIVFEVHAPAAPGAK